MKKAKRFFVAVAGLIVLLLGVVMIPYPGPGWLVVFAGLGILAKEFDWAKRLLHWIKAKYKLYSIWLNNQSLAIKFLAWVGTITIVLLTLWVMNGFGILNTFFGFDWDWVDSPLPILH